MPLPPVKKTRYEHFFLGMLIIVAFFFRFYGMGDQLAVFGILSELEQNHVFLSALFGTISILLVYLLVRHIFGNWKIAAMSSFLLAVSSWHVWLSRSGSLAIIGSVTLLLSLVALWRAMATASRASFFLAGLLLGVSVYFYSWNWLFLICAGLTIAAYWLTVLRHLPHGHEYVRTKIAYGTGLFVAGAGLVILPLQLGMLMLILSPPAVDVTFSLSSYSILWPVSFLAAIGFLRACVKLFAHRKHRHFSTMIIFLLSWVAVGLIAASLQSSFSPSAGFIILPVIFILAAETLWWAYDFIVKWYGESAKTVEVYGGSFVGENILTASATVIIFLASVALVEYCRVFGFWLG